MASVDEKRRREWSALDQLGLLLSISLGAGLVAIAASNGEGLSAAVGISVLIFLASFSVGGFFGFLFGVPRVLSREGGQAPDGVAKAAAGSDDVPPVNVGAGSTSGTASSTSATKLRLLQSNTNLERISDWLTTMLVGASLVELHRANEGLVRFRDFLSVSARVFPQVGGTWSAGVLPAIGPIILLFGASCGFLYMYLKTRLALVRMFHAIELMIAGEEKLPATEQRALRGFLHSSGAGSFLQGFLVKKSDLTVDDALNVMFNLLYKDDPKRVIELAAQLSASDAVARPDYWFYSAAAFGQMLHHLDTGSDEWLSTRDNALDCARRAVALDPAYRSRLWQISDPDGADDDLAPLRRDDEFLRIVGRHPE